MVRKLVRLLVVVVLVGVPLVAWQSPYYALYRLDRALDERDVVTAESYVDLEEVVKSTAALAGTFAADALGGGHNDVGGRVLGALIGGVAQGVGEAAAPAGAAELRRAIVEGRVEPRLGPFRVHEGWSALGPIEVHDRTALVTLRGSCGKNEDASLRTVWSKRDGAYFGYPRRWVLVGIDAESAKQLARSCK